MLKPGLKDKVIEEYLSGGISFRELSRKYGVSRSAICRWVQAATGKVPKEPDDESKVIVQLPDEVKALQEQLRKAQLHNKLLNAMLDLGKEQYGIDLRKKPGTKRS